jgi:hypothetical protein
VVPLAPPVSTPSIQSGLGRRWLLGALIVIAFGLRVFRLGTQSLWGDEAFSVFRAYESLGEITAAVPREGTLPPLYYYLLHFWIPLAGSTETAVRFLSLWFGVISIPLFYLLVRRLLGDAIAFTAAVLATLSPFWIYYAQETRTYAQTNAFVVLALYLLLRASTADGPSVWRWWSAYAAAATLALYSYYFAGFVLAVAVLWLLVVQRGRRVLLVPCILAQVAVLAALAPLIIYTASSLLGLARSVERGGVPIGTILDHLTRVFSYGTSIEPQRAWPFVVVAVALVLTGVASMPRSTAAFWGMALVGPVIAIYVISFVPHNGWERYFMTASPAWYALMASGVVAWTRGRPAGIALRSIRGARAASTGIAAAAGVAILAGISISLQHYYFDPAFWRYDLRDADRRVETPPTSDVAVIVNGPRNYPSFFYYFQKRIPWAELPCTCPTTSDTVRILSAMAARYRGLWLVKYHPQDYDPNGLVEVWLDEHAYQASLTWVENVTYSFYLTEDPRSAQTVASFPVERTFGADVTLETYRASITHAQGADYLLVTLTWRALRTPPENLRVFAHLIDAGGHRVSQRDHYPVADLRPAWTWRAGDRMVDRFALRLPPAPIGRGLQLVVGLYRPDGSRLPVIGTPVWNGALPLPIPGLNPPPPHAVLPRRLGNAIELEGFSVAPNPVHAGQPLSLTLLWRRIEPVGQDYTVFTHLLGPDQRLVAQDDAPPLHGQWPTSAWLEGQTLVDPYRITVPPGTPPGRYQIEVGMYDPATGRRLPVRSGTSPGAATSTDRVLLPVVVQVTR